MDNNLFPGYMRIYVEGHDNPIKAANKETILPGC